MLSSLLLVVTTVAFQIAQPQAGSDFHPASTTVPSRPEPPKSLSAEQRADIMMARKMYREAIEKYKESPQDSAVIANKIGIAYHQLLDLDMAKKYYERSVKLDHTYA